MTDRDRYRVSGKVGTLRTTYLCNSRLDALAAYRHLVKGEYTAITITAPDGRDLAEADLVTGEGNHELTS